MESEYITPEKLGAHFKSKRDIYRFLTVDQNLFLPSYKHCSLEFIRQVFDGSKKALTNDKINSFIISLYKELSVAKIWSMIKDVDDMIQYFPDYKQNEKPERSYLTGVISTLNPEATKEIIKEAREKRSVCEVIDLSNLVKITPEVRNAITKSNMQKTTRGVSNFLLKAKAKLRKSKKSPKVHVVELQKLKAINKTSSAQNQSGINPNGRNSIQEEKENEESKEESMRF